MFRTLIKVMIIYTTILQLYSKPKNLCREFMQCSCYNVEGNLKIECSRSNKFDRLLPSLLRKYSDKMIKSISIYKCSDRMLKKNIFKNASIYKIEIKCPFENIDPESLNRVRGLTTLNMQFTKFKKVPWGIQRLHNLKHLLMWRGRLTSIKNDFKNMTFIQVLYLSKNRISYVSHDAFHSNKHLYKIDLSHNRIAFLSQSTIRFNINLRNFAITFNKLRSVRGLLKDTYITVTDFRGNKIQFIDQMFGNMSYLELLNLGKNKGLKLTDASFSKPFIPLEVLKMDKCKLKTLPPKLLRPLSCLQDVDFSSNELHSVPEKFFYGLRHLKTVKLNRNKIKHLNTVFKTNANLHTVNLNNNEISKIGRVFKYTKFLQTLILSRNRLKTIDEDDFKYSASLTTLNLNYNGISNITSKAFVALKNLTSLELSSNAIYSLDSLKSLRNLQFLTLRYNKLEKIEEFDFKYMNQLKILDLSFNSIRSVNKAFRSLVNLKTLKINDNNLTTLSKNSFPPDFRNAALQTTGNMWICDCRLLWIRDLLADYRVIELKKRMRCFQPLRFHRKKLRHMSAEKLITWPKSCPPSCKCDCVPEEEEFFVKVDCSMRKLTKIPPSFPNETGELYLQENYLADSISLQVDGYIRLRSVNLEGNQLNHINLGRFGNLNSLLLARNHFGRFFSSPPENIMTWTLSGNPWICDCKAVEFRNWLLSHRTKILDINETRCIFIPGREDIADKVIIDLSEEDLCPCFKKIYIILSVIVLAVVLLLAAICYLIFRCHSFKIKAWLFSRGMTSLKREMNGDSRKKYDAFISAADEDMPFVQNFIIPELEQQAPFYSLFEPRRNLSAEEAWEIENLIEAVVNSKRIMVLLSEDYIQNNFFVEFLNRISDYFVEGGLHRLIPIIVGKLPSSSVIDPAIKTAVEPQRCLQKDQKLFWEMLRYAMPFKKIEDIEDTQSRGSTEQLMDQ